MIVYLLKKRPWDIKIVTTSAFLIYFHDANARILLPGDEKWDNLKVYEL